MYCIVEILTSQQESNQGLGRTYGPYSDIESAKEAGTQLCDLSLHDYPGCEIYEMDKDDLEGDDFVTHGFSIETEDNDVKALYLIKELFAVAIPQVV